MHQGQHLPSAGCSPAVWLYQAPQLGHNTGCTTSAWPVFSAIHQGCYATSQHAKHVGASPSTDGCTCVSATSYSTSATNHPTANDSVHQSPTGVVHIHSAAPWSISDICVSIAYQANKVIVATYPIRTGRGFIATYPIRTGSGLITTYSTSAGKGIVTANTTRDAFTSAPGNPDPVAVVAIQVVVVGDTASPVAGAATQDFVALYSARTR